MPNNCAALTLTRYGVSAPRGDASEAGAPLTAAAASSKISVTSAYFDPTPTPKIVESTFLSGSWNGADQVAISS